MHSSRRPLVWLAYVSYPVTTAVYIERALRRRFPVVTCGPKIDENIIKRWSLEEMKLPVLDQNISVPYEPDMDQVMNDVRGRVPTPDLYLWIESVPGYLPKNLRAIACPKACYLIDTHLHLDWHVQWAQNFDIVFLAQREYVPEFQAKGCRNVHWLPLACDPEIHSRRSMQKKFDVGFVGSIFPGTRRAQLLQKLCEKRFYVHVQRCFWDEMAHVFSESRIVFNNCARNDLNMRVFEAMSTGSFLLTDEARNSGLDELFVDGEDLGVYRDEELVEKARYYLIHEEEREHVASRGQAMVHQAHTYEHRCEALLQVCLGQQSSTPSAAEWRERSLRGLTLEGKWRPRVSAAPKGRSFVIPVVDASKKGQEELAALLSDLESIEGEVIVVFNSVEAAGAFRDHSRINLSACLNVNVGVSRAWNIGVHMSTQPAVFFLNADLRVTRAACDTLENALWHLSAAAVVGPEGSFFGFYTAEDIVWYSTHKATEPLCVDAVSGFFFAAKRELFLRKVLQFDDRYTPCFQEEWDLGLQARQHGYRCYILPVEGYQHAWGVSKDMKRVIRYLRGEQASAIEIAARNRIHFWRKWLEVADEFNDVCWDSSGPPESPSGGPALLQSRIMEQKLSAKEKLPEA